MCGGFVMIPSPVPALRTRQEKSTFCTQVFSGYSESGDAGKMMDADEPPFPAIRVQRSPPGASDHAHGLQRRHNIASSSEQFFSITLHGTHAGTRISPSDARPS